MEEKKEPSLEEDRIIDLFHNPEFLLRLEKIKTRTEILNAFRENNIQVNQDTLEALYNICERYIRKGLEVIDEEKFLEDVAAGKCTGIKENETNSQNMAEKILGMIKEPQNRG